MKMFDHVDVKFIVESFLAEYFGFDYVTLSSKQIESLEKILDRSAGFEINNFERQ